MNIDKPDAQLARQSIAERSAEPQNQVAPKPSSAPPAVNTSAEPQFSHGVQALLESSRSAGASGVDQARVERIRQAIEEGTYHVDPERLAQRFLDLENLIDQ